MVNISQIADTLAVNLFSDSCDIIKVSTLYCAEQHAFPMLMKNGNLIYNIEKPSTFLSVIICKAIYQ